MSTEASMWKLQGVCLCWRLLQPALPKLQALQDLLLPLLLLLMLLLDPAEEYKSSLAW